MASRLAKRRRRNPTVDMTHPMLTRSRTTNIIRQAVLDTNELLENILVNVGIPDLLHLRRVNKKWNALMLTSPSLQRKFFLAPVRHYDKWVVDKRAQSVMKYIESDKTRVWGAHQGSVVVSKANPLFLGEESEQVKDSLSYIQRYEYCEILKLTKKPDLKLLGRGNNLIHQMYVCQPPCVKLEMQVEYYERKPSRERHHSVCYPGKTRIVVKNDIGVTLGDVLQGFIDQIGLGTSENPSTGYTIRIDRSMFWCIGVIFPSQKEVVIAEANAARDAQIAASKEATCAPNATGSSFVMLQGK